MKEYDVGLKVLAICSLMAFVACLPSSFVSGYEVGQDTPVHEYITNESRKILTTAPHEFHEHFTTAFTHDTGSDHDMGDDVITGSSEEDDDGRFFLHFWQPDDPNNGDYDDGLALLDSSYRRAIDLWRESISAYVRGEIDESYYLLGRTAHLLEDAAQPSHVHVDPHPPNTPDNSILEEWTADDNYLLYDGSSYEGEQYNYESLIPGFDWSAVEPTRTPDTWNIELFRLFWYTAQKTQYWASDDEDGNLVYVEIDEDTQSWSCSGTGSLNLWAGEGYTSCGDFIDESDDLNETSVEQEADAVVPHAMRATAGLYRLFWDAVHAPTWETSHHDNRRTGHTPLKGDLTSSDHEVTLQHASDATTEFWDDILITDLDEDYGNGDGLELVVAATNFTYQAGKVYAIRGDGDPLWSYTDSGKLADVRATTIANIDGDDRKEIVFGSVKHITGYLWSNESTLYVIEANHASVFKECTFQGTSLPLNGHAAMMGIAIDDLDNDGEKEILASEFSLYSGTYKLYSLESDCSKNWNASLGAFGSQEMPALADLDGDGTLEAIVVGIGQSPIRIFNAEDGSAYSSTTANGTSYYIYTDPVVADIDADGEYEIVVGLYSMDSQPETPRLLVFDDEGELEWQKALDFTPVATPAVADLDGDAALEIVVATAEDPDWDNAPDKGVNNGSVYAFDGATQAQQWKRNMGAKVQASPAIADIDNDGELEIIVTDYSGTLSVIGPSGSLEWSESLGSYPLSSPAIGDIDGDGVAEIALKHAHGVGKDADWSRGPPGMVKIYQGQGDEDKEKLWLMDLKRIAAKEEAMKGTGKAAQLLLGAADSTLEVFGGTNAQPVLGNISDVSVLEGALVDINASGTVTATDPDGDSLVFSYRSPLNASGRWQTGCSDAGNHTVMVEVDDGSLSRWQHVRIQVNESCA